MMRKIFKSKKSFIISNYARKLIDNECGIDSDIWFPYIDIERVRVDKAKQYNKVIGYYSAGTHKGDRIFDCLVDLMPDYNFIIMGYKTTVDLTKSNVKRIDCFFNAKPLLKKISLMLVPSVIDEGYPRIIIEALSNSIPVIANRVGGIPEALGDGGILIDKEEADLETANKYKIEITKVLSSDSTYEYYSNKAKERCVEYLKEIKTQNMKFIWNFMTHSEGL